MIITVYSMEKCHYCVVAKQALAERGLAFRDVPIDFHPDNYEEFRTRLPDARTVPQIVVGNEVIGGANDLLAIIDTPRFQQLIGGQ